CKSILQIGVIYMKKMDDWLGYFKEIEFLIEQVSNSAFIIEGIDIKSPGIIYIKKNQLINWILTNLFAYIIEILNPSLISDSLTFRKIVQLITELKLAQLKPLMLALQSNTPIESIRRTLKYFDK